MKCNICGHENPPGGGFCGGCGAWIGSKPAAHQAGVPQQAPVQPVVQTSLNDQSAQQPPVQTSLNEQSAQQPVVQTSLNQQPGQQPPVQAPPSGYYPGPIPAGGESGSGAGTPPEKPRKKKPVWLFILIPVLLVAALVVGYFTIHIWTDPSCTEPAECQICGTTRGDPTGHSWRDADCENPQTCVNCGGTKGSPLDHQWSEPDCKNPSVCTLCGESSGEPMGHEWMTADCTHPEICSRCGQVQGSPLGHSWEDADCVTAQTCDVCGVTEGEPLGHDWAEATYDTPQTCKACGIEEGVPKGYLGTLHGNWAEDRVWLGYWSVLYKTFDPIENCKRFTFNLELTDVTQGSVNGTWDLYGKTEDGTWQFIKSFTVSGEDTVVELTFDRNEAISFDRLAVTRLSNTSCSYSIAFHLTDVQVYVD